MAHTCQKAYTFPPSPRNSHPYSHTFNWNFLAQNSSQLSSLATTPWVELTIAPYVCSDLQRTSHRPMPFSSSNTLHSAETLSSPESLVSLVMSHNSWRYEKQSFSSRGLFRRGLKFICAHHHSITGIYILPSAKRKCMVPRSHQIKGVPHKNGTVCSAYITSAPLMCVHILKSCLTLCDPIGYSPPGSSGHGISQARILEWVAISFSRGPWRPRDRNHTTCVSCLVGRFFTSWAIGEISSTNSTF